MGPFAREPLRRHLGLPAISDPYERYEHHRRHLRDALAGIQLTELEQRHLDWLAGCDTTTVAVLAGWIKRARRDAGYAQECPGCDHRGLDVRQEPTGSLVCHRCGRMVAAMAPLPLPPEAGPEPATG